MSRLDPFRVAREWIEEQEDELGRRLDTEGAVVGSLRLEEPSVRGTGAEEPGEA